MTLWALLTSIILLGCKTPNRSPSALASTEATTPDDDIENGDPIGGMPPSIIFHVGKKLTLDEDINAHTVPQDAWDTYIMGDITRFDLPTWRRGLYGTIAPLRSFWYGEDIVAAHQDPWVMGIRINPSCTDRSGIFIPKIDMALNAEPSPFLSLEDSVATQYFPSLEKMHNRCLEGNDGAKTYNYGPSIETGGEDTPCQKILQDFVSKKKYRIVFDIINHDSWFLRDRSCIQTIEGTPDDVLNWMANSPQFWHPDALVPEFSTELSIFSEALSKAHADTLTPTFLQRLEDGVVANLSQGTNSPKVKALGQELATLFEIAKNCVTSGHLSALQAAAEAYHAKIIAGDHPAASSLSCVGEP